MKSTRKRRAIGSRYFALAAALLVATAAGAHHSASMYDSKKETVFEGKVVEFQWINPHAFILLDISTKDGVKRYTVECSATRGLVQAGWKRTSLKPGDRVKVRVWPLRDGRPGGELLEVTFPDGRTLREGWYDGAGG